MSEEKNKTKLYELKDGCLIYYLPKELDHYYADYIKSKTENIFRKEQVEIIVFDFSLTEFMDSSGIGLITGRYRKICDMGGKTCVINMNESIDKLLLMSGIYRIVEKLNSISEVTKQ